MRFICIFALFSFCFMDLSNTTEYEGLRVDMSALTLNRDILASIIPALNRTLNHTFKSISETGSLGAVLTLKNIKITKPVINENLLDMVRYEYKYPIYQLKGNDMSIYFNLAFDYSMSWIITLASGKGTGVVTNQAKQILVFFNESEPDVQLPHPWGISNIVIPWNIFLTPTWITSLLQQKFITEFHKVVDDSMHDFAHQLFSSYTRIEDAFNQTIDLIFYNTLLSASPTLYGIYFSIGFDSNVTINENYGGHYARNLYRRMTITVIAETDFNFCLAAQLVPDVIDVLGKDGYYDMDVPFYHWGFQDSTVRQLFDIVPGLESRYTGSEIFQITCQLSRYLSVNDLGKRNEFTLLKFMHPIYCTIMIPEVGSYALIIDLFFHFYYSLKEVNKAFMGQVNEVVLQNFKTAPELPVVNRQTLKKYLDYFSIALSNKELLSPGIRVEPKRKNELKFERTELYYEEICFYYSEIRPITPFVNEISNDA